MQTTFFFFNYHPIYHLIPMSLALLFHRLLSPSQTYIIDFSCLKPPKSLRVPVSMFHEHLCLMKCFDKESVSFMTKVVTSSGMGNETCFPPSLHLIPPSSKHEDAIQESHMLFFPTLDELFAKTKVLPREIDLVVVNCSGFCASPSLSSIIVNHYDMRSDVKSYNISGMGCGAGVIGVDIAKGFLEKRRARSYALVISTEILSTGWYRGKDTHKLVLNCFFRMGCAAALVTNHGKAGTSQPKYHLRHLLRTQHTFDDIAYHVASLEEDDEGITGFSIERHVANVVSDLLRSHLKYLGPIILPWEEKIRYIMSHIFNDDGIEYVPDFKKAVTHLCFPSSGMQLIKRVGKGLGFDEEELEAVLATFRRYGNQSSASIWYQMAYSEARGKIKKGDKVLQLGLGSGPKCNSLVLECVRDFDREENSGPWG
ncbi:3-ketoacyl-CoA synthase 4-like protein [Carex littledalei]|uniref:3-ketoacyl-CoA synthase n=1 Tax=Carex littledalei TaxID=544730 RepID=A0A833VG90_9POAL|nr:3-ketoacyl-CoA synthase 4-like protein [Carex littledalei]